MINAAGAALLTKSEGIRLKAYLCPAGVPTIGRGHTKGITAQMVRDGYTITPDQERTLFVEDMVQWERDVRECLKRKPNDNQLAAFICLAYNIGIAGFKKSTVLREFEKGDDMAAATAFAMWNKATVSGKKIVVRGLVTRRAEEAALFLTPETGADPIPQSVADVANRETGGTPVSPFLFQAGAALLEAVPKLVSLFGSGSEISQRNAKAVELAVDVAKTAIGATNEQELVERIANDPIAAEQVKAAIESNWFQLTEVGGGVQEARKADAVFVSTGKSPLASPSLLIALALLPLVYAIVGAVVGLWGEAFSDDVRSAIANGVIGLILGGLIGYYYGQTTSTNRTPAQKE